MSEPIEDALRNAADVLNFAIPPRLPYMTPGEAQLMQAQLIQELAKRIVGLELREPKPAATRPGL